MGVKLKVNTYVDIAVVDLKEKALDASNSEKLKKSMAETLNDYEKVVLDLSRVEFVDSSGCGALLSCLRQLGDRGGELKLCGVQKNVQRLFELVRMNRIIDIYPTKDDALKGF
ncbi:MAG: STAS domain-containing protein [Desulfobacterales bacterium]|nr:STAS domain-containing protein [Desulfobacterales bacterium]